MSVVSPQVLHTTNDKKGNGPRYTPARLVAVLTVILVGAYALPLFRLVRLSLENQLWSHVLLVPWISFYLVWLRRRQVPAAVSFFSVYAAIPLLLGIVVISTFCIVKLRQSDVAPTDYLSFTTLSFVLFLIGGVAWILGPARTRALAFPLAFLLFMVPFPTFLTHAIEFFFQHASADAASLMFAVAQTPVLRDGLFFKLPGITIEVAQECSGIRSTLVLLITSLVGAYLFFHSKTHRALLTLAIIPIAIVRNGFRIFTIAMLCVHISPDMIRSWIHKRGGPIFFALSLIPFFLLLLFLYRRERKAAAANVSRPGLKATAAI
jgi:exosortase C (VPDSG-CTERM-specific)